MLDKFSKEMHLHVFDKPVETPAIQIVQVWHERNHRDPHHQWLREQIRNILIHQ
jgi:DNA-binding transcriptional LysR family regulator